MKLSHENHIEVGRKFGEFLVNLQKNKTYFQK